MPIDDTSAKTAPIRIRFPLRWSNGSPSASGCSPSRCGSPCSTRFETGRPPSESLQEATGASQQNVSKHLGVLLRTGIVGRRKEGNFSVYWIADPMVLSLCEEVCGGLRREAEELGALLEGGK